jgi:hypothetical protein
VNVFVLDRDPVRAARALCDRHVVKMTLETAQILCTAARTLGQRAPYRPTHARHPCVAWAAARRANWEWLVRHGLALADEFERRFGRVHRSRAVILRVARLGPPPAPVGRRQPFAQVMPERYRGGDPVLAYRRYYLGEKAGFATWRPPARPPRWWPRSGRGPAPRLRRSGASR